MKKHILTFLVVIAAITAKAQGNLQFNQVLNIIPGISYTVPAGKVFKLESMTTSNSSVTTNYIGQSGCGPNGCCTCNYATQVYLTINNIQFSAGPGGTTRCSFDGGCSAFPTNTGPISITPMDFPIWLKAQNVISLGSNVSGIFLSGIEFNVVP